MWIILTLACAFTQALWMALSKLRLQTLSPVQFMLFLRLPIIVVLGGIFMGSDAQPVTLQFWLVVVVGAVLECVRVVSFAYGSSRDYYAAYSLLNMSPIVVLLLAPRMVGDKVTLVVVAGVMCVVIGGLVFYRAGRFSLAGLISLISQGTVTTLFKMGLKLSSPAYFMFVFYGLSVAILLVFGCVRSGFGRTVLPYREAAKRMLPLSALNLVSILTFSFGLNLAQTTHFAILFRTSLIFGFILSLLLLKEYAGWKRKLAGGLFILVGSALIALKGE